MSDVSAWEPSGHGPGQRDVSGRLIVAQAQVDGLAQLSVSGQFLVGNLRDQLRSQIGNFSLARGVY